LRLQLKTGMANAGKSALIAAGAGFGLLRGLRALGNINRNAARLSTIQARIDTIHVAVARLAEQTEQLQTRLEQRVTRDELAGTIDRVFRQLEEGVDARFQHQSRSVEALQTMVGQTDVLLQRVLEGLESMKSERQQGAGRIPDDDPTAFKDLSRKWDLTQANRETAIGA
jgi:chromosome segregation ATPase